MATGDAGVVRFRDWVAKLVPWWLSDRRLTSGKWTGYRLLWSIAAYLDAMVETALQALRAPWPGIGTPTALPLIAASRGILRGQADTDATFSVKLVKWLRSITLPAPSAESRVYPSPASVVTLLRSIRPPFSACTDCP